MKSAKSKTHELRNRCLFTLFVLLIYMIGRTIVLTGVNPGAYGMDQRDAQSIVISMVSGDKDRYTLMALGIMPGILASMLVQFGLALAGKDFSSRMSPQKVKRITWLLMVIIAAVYAVSRAGELILYKDLFLPSQWVRILDMIEMMAGAFLIYGLCQRNREHGVGGETIVIIFNIGNNFWDALQGHSLGELIIPLILCLVMIIITLIMENVTVHIPVQRVSIHNSYADKDYLAFKLHPIGVMPVMFATVIFMVPQLIFALLASWFPKNDTISMINQNMVLTSEIGVNVFLAVIFLQTILFTFLLLNPSDIAEQLQKGGDSIVGVYAGRKTRRFLRRRLLLLSCISGIVLSAGMGVSLYLSLKGIILADLAMLSSTGMIFVGMICSIVREIASYRRFDSYRFFV